MPEDFELPVRKSWLMKLEKRLPWGVFGALLGIAGLYVAFREARPAVTFEISSVSNVFDVYRPLPDLTVLFKGEDIQKSGRNVRIVTLVLANTGDANVVQGDYDRDQPFGFTIPGSQIVGAPRVIRADSEYLAESLRPRLLDESTVELNKVILEKQQAAVFELLLLQDKTAPLEIKPVGKISGQQRIAVENSASDNRPSIWKVAIEGGFRVNTVRFLFSTLALIGLLIVSIFIGVTYESLLRNARRRRLLHILRPATKQLDRQSRKALVELLALTNGGKGIDPVIDALGSPDSAHYLKQQFDRYQTMLQNFAKPLDKKVTLAEPMREPDVNFDRKWASTALGIVYGEITNADGSLKAGFAEALEKVRHLRDEGRLPDVRWQDLRSAPSSFILASHLSSPVRENPDASNL